MSIIIVRDKPHYCIIPLNWYFPHLLAFFVGISEHIGHGALTLLILIDKTQKIIYHLVMHFATNQDTKILRADIQSDMEPQQQIQSHFNDDVQGDEAQQPKIPIIDLEELVGKALSATQEDGETTRIKIIEAISGHHDMNSMSKPTVKFRCSIRNDVYEEILSYNQIM